MTKINYIITTDHILLKRDRICLGQLVTDMISTFVRIYSLVCMILLQKSSCNGEKNTQLINRENYTIMFLVKYNNSLGCSFLIVPLIFSNVYFLYHL